MNDTKEYVMPFGKAATFALCWGLAGMPQALLAADTETVAVEIELSDLSADARALSGDEAAGKKLYRRNCRACHGATGMGAASYPKLVGQPAEFLIDKVARYRAGEKFGPNTPLMAQRVNTLSDQDIANVAAFIVSLEDG